MYIEMVQQFFTTLTNTQFLVFSLFKDIRQEVNVSKSTEKKKIKGAKIEMVCA